MFQILKFLKKAYKKANNTNYHSDGACHVY